jgi:RNA 2',3'-cyclic 3'-phosphodiesterase
MTHETKMKRTFIAIPVETSPRLLTILGDLKMKLKGEGIKWAEPFNLHITLRFLGETIENQIIPISRKISSLSLAWMKQEGKISGLDYFVSHGNPAVLFARLENLPQLEGMANSLGRELEEFGFATEPQKFRPHLTLARIKYLRNKNFFYNSVDSYQTVEIQPVTIEKVVFYESILLPQGPVYKPLNTVLLKNNLES